MNKPTHVAPQFLVVGFGRSFIARSTMRKKPIAVQEILWGISAADDRDYNKEFGNCPRGHRRRGERPARILTYAHRAGRSKPAVERRAFEGTSGKHVCAYTAGKRTCAADRRFTQPGHYFLECLGKR